jgi:hypothetical protein
MLPIVVWDTALLVAAAAAVSSAATANISTRTVLCTFLAAGYCVPTTAGNSASLATAAIAAQLLSGSPASTLLGGIVTRRHVHSQQE